MALVTMVQPMNFPIAAAHINKLVRKVSHDCRQANRSNVEGCLCSYRPTMLHNYLVLTSSTILHSTYMHYMQQFESRIWKSSHNMLDIFMLWHRLNNNKLLLLLLLLLLLSLCIMTIIEKILSLPTRNLKALYTFRS